MAPPRYAPYQPRRRNRQSPPAVPLSSPGPTAAPTCAVTQDQSQQAWSRLPGTVHRSLQSAGVNNADDFRMLDIDATSSVLALPSVRPFNDVLLCFRSVPFDMALFLQRLMSAPRESRSRTVHAALGAPVMPYFRPTPSESIRVLAHARSQGADIEAVLDGIIDCRAGSSIAQSSGRTYSSHLTQIRRVCGLLQAQVCPADISTIRRVSAVVNHPSTLRGWLSAWRHLHILARHPWRGDGDPHLYAARAGLARHTEPPPVRRRMRGQRLLRTLRPCVQAGHYFEAAAAALAYIYGLRVPSELLRQARSDMFRCRGHRITYGPVRRKGKVAPSALTRYCCCASQPLLCAHPWVAFLHEHAEQGLCFGFTAAQLMARLQPFLQASGVPADQLSSWTSHCFRRGSAIDVLEHQGVAAMVAHGEWANPRSAEPYASAEEQHAVQLAAAMWAIDGSDDDPD